MPSSHYINITFLTGWHCRLSPQENIVTRGGAEVDNAFPVKNVIFILLYRMSHFYHEFQRLETLPCDIQNCLPANSPIRLLEINMRYNNLQCNPVKNVGVFLSTIAEPRLTMFPRGDNLICHPVKNVTFILLYRMSHFYHKFYRRETLACDIQNCHPVKWPIRLMEINMRYNNKIYDRATKILSLNYIAITMWATVGRFTKWNSLKSSDDAN